jgi:UDP-N-acetylmuramate--alanine ligase
MYTAGLEAAGIHVATQHDPAHVTGQARLAVTKALTAIDPDHPELLAARSAGIPMEPWQQVVADAAATSGQRLVAVSGTHGKSTTTGWLVDVLIRADRDPSAFVGALLGSNVTGGVPSTARWGTGDAFVVEADEYAGNFDPYQPSLIVLLNAEWDHPDVFADTEAVLRAFVAWIRRAPGATLVANTDDPGVKRIVDRLGDWRGAIVAAPSSLPAGWDVGLPGPANRSNALAVLGAARILDVDEAAVRESLAAYQGVGRRMEVKGEVDGVTVIDDYGHHPTAIAKTLEAVRGKYAGRRVWDMYEPMTYHRTALMLDGFATALAAADEVAIADIWAGRDPDTTITSANMVADAVRRAGGPDAKAPGSVEDTADFLSEQVRPGDVVLVMGGGRSYVIAERLVELLRAR